MADVPCNGCRECCQNQRILLDPDEVGHFFSVPTALGDGPVRRMLPHLPNGDCTYLTPQGCAVHGAAPRACQEFDCRAWLRKFDEKFWPGMEKDGLDGGVVTAARERM